ncbi:FUSC family protein [Sphingomonas sp. KR3-1]|uniref:FUSC family protein n=1 Tax=Sphingomonas sp. KR3-1 TaxID=3156611 RepID=UPI0032B45448
MRLSTKHRAHLGEAFHWTPIEPLTLRTLAIAMFAMGVPVITGFALGKPALGLVIGLGSMLLANETPGQAPGQATEGGHGWGASIVPALLAVPAAMLLGRVPWSDAAMVGLSAAAATLVNWSRPAAGGAVRFIIFLILNLGLSAAGGGAHRGGAALLFGIGALWRAVLRRLFRPRHAPAPAAPEAPPARVVTPRQRRIHFRRTMGTLQGWQYPIRLGFGLTAAVLLRDLWPERHLGWIVLTIALLTPRAIEHLPVQITQRVAGTLAGVALAGAILWLSPGHVLLAAMVVALGVAAPLARAGNYALYCLLSTPVILLAIDAGTEGEAGLLADRLIATLGGAAVIFAANWAMDRAMEGRKAT